MDKPMVECPFQVDSWSYGWTKYESGWDLRNFSASALASFQFWPVTTTSTSSACEKGFLDKVSCFLTRIFIRKIPFEIVFCCYNCLNLLWEKFFQVWVTCFPSSWEQENSVEKRLCKFEAEGREFVTFSRHCSCSRELGKQVTNTLIFLY